MAKLNHARPHLKIVDNLRRVLAAADACYALESKSINDCNAISTMPKQRSRNKKCVQIKFHGNELKLCQALLDSIELYYSNFESFLNGFMTKSKKKDHAKSKLGSSSLRMGNGMMAPFSIRRYYDYAT